MLTRTEVNIDPKNKKIELADNIFTIGSCFAGNMAERLARYNQKVIQSAFGVMYNPISICNILTGNDIGTHYTSHLGLWFCYGTHSQVHANTQEALAMQIQELSSKTQVALSMSKFIIITWGTAYVYALADSGYIVANCHKADNKLFTKRFLTEQEITDAFEKCHRHLTHINPNLNIILTVSPVRHIKDTLQHNGVSKAILRCATHAMCTKYDNVQYFPSYEIMLDDLRDYGYYKEDMIHPNEIAEKYIWKKFINTYYTDNDLEYYSDYDKILSAINHKPFYPQSNDYQIFIKNTLDIIAKWEHKADMNEAKKYFRSKLYDK
ncbi:MAG: GSCFA domain-containing protein [Cytophagales bacterium]|nr:GSCFA domain-containing protein [Cytophagales bacterium]